MSNRPNRKPSHSARVTQAQKAGARSLTWIYICVGVAVALALIVAVLVAGRSSSDSSLSTVPGATVVPKGELVYGDVKVTGAPLAELGTAGGDDPAIGQVAPTVAGQQFDGAPLTIPGAGQPKVVMFLAHWCPHCQAEVPVLTKYLAANGLPAGVNLYAVATGTSETRANFPPADWLRKEGWPVPTIADDDKGAAAAGYGVTGFPYFVAVDASGKVVARTSGELSTERFEGLLNAARSGTGSTTGTSGPSSPASR